MSEHQRRERVRKLEEHVLDDIDAKVVGTHDAIQAVRADRVIASVARHYVEAISTPTRTANPQADALRTLIDTVRDLAPTQRQSTETKGE